MTGDWSALKQAAENATPGPWWVERGGDGHLDPSEFFYAVNPGARWRGSTMMNPINCRDDEATARFIASADPSTVLALVAENEELRAENKRLIEAFAADEAQVWAKLRAVELELYGECPSGCGCVTEDDPDRSDCGCDGPCCMDDEWPRTKASVLAAEVERLRWVIGAVADVCQIYGDKILIDNITAIHGWPEQVDADAEVIVGDVPGLTDANPNDANVAPQPEVQP